MSDRYYRKRNKDVKNNDSINELTNIILDLQRKIRYLEHNINLKNIFRYSLKDNIYIRFDKESKNTYNIINILLKNLKKEDILERHTKLRAEISMADGRNFAAVVKCCSAPRYF